MSPPQPLSLEEARAPFPFSCTREQPGLLRGCEPLLSVPGKQRAARVCTRKVQVALREHSSLVGFPFLQGFGMEFKRWEPKLCCLLSKRLEAGVLIPPNYSLPPF